MGLLGTIAANTIGFADALTPGRLGQTLNNNIRNPNYDIYGTPFQPASIGGPNRVASSVGGMDYNFAGEPIGPTPGSQSSGGGQAPGAAAAASDPYAQYGGQTNYNSLISGFNTQKSNIYGSANEAAQNQGIGINSSILDFLGGLKTGQQSIDNRAINNELAKRQGTQGVLGMVNRGIQSGGVTLANRNASDSSAAGAIARAYGDIGRRELSNVGSQYELENRDIGLAQSNFDEQANTGARKITESKNQIVNNIVLDARNKFAQLDAAMAEASLPERLQIEQEKENVRQQVAGILSQYDQTLAQGRAGIAPTDANARRTEATRLAGLGQAPAESFDFSTETPAQLQGTGPFASDLPIFTIPRAKRTA